MANTHQIVPSYNEIIPGIYVGNQAASQSVDVIRQLKITTIVNATKHIPNKIKGVTYYRIPVNDPGIHSDPKYWQQQNEIMLSYLGDVCEFIHQRKKDGPILIHCHAGSQRSICVMTAYICKYVHPNYQNVIQYILLRRPIAYSNGTNVNFSLAIKKFLNK